MRRRTLLATLAVLSLSPIIAHAQDKETRQAARKISEILTEFNEEMRGYDRELKYFQRVPDFKPLNELRSELLFQASRMRKMETAGRGAGRPTLELAREMNKTARRLDVATSTFEKRAESVASREDRAVAVRMKGHAGTMVKTLDQLITMFR